MTMSDNASSSSDDVLAAIPQLTVLLDRDGRVRHVNDVYRAWYGRPPALGGTLVDLLGDGAASLSPPAAWEGLLAGREVEAQCHAARGGGVVVVIQDVGERRQVEREARARALETDRLRDLFLAMLGHDLRGPMSTVNTAAGYLLRHANLRGGQARALARIVTSGERMARMIAQLLDYTRGRLGGGMPLAVETTDLGDVVEEVVNELEIVHPEREFIVARDGPLEGDWDRDRLAEVVANLLGNAAQHGAPETPIHITLAGVDGHASVAVENDGPAIPAVVLPVLFDPVRRRGVDGRAGTGRSLGLGLYISREIVAAHGGSIEARSRDGERTLFRMTLPRAPRRPPSRDADPR